MGKGAGAMGEGAGAVGEGAGAAGQGTGASAPAVSRVPCGQGPLHHGPCTLARVPGRQGLVVVMLLVVLLPAAC